MAGEVEIIDDNELELQTRQLSNGDDSQTPTGAASNAMAVPKHLAGRKQSSSKKFKIETVAASDDPLFNPNAPRSPSRKLCKAIAIEEVPTAEVSTSFAKYSGRTEPEGSGGESVFQSVEDLAGKPRASSILTSDQRFYSIENLDAEKSLIDEPDIVSTGQIVLSNPLPPSIVPVHNETGSARPTPHDSAQEDSLARPGRAIRTRRRAGDQKLKIDDSFYKKATIEMKVDSQDNPDPEAVTDIYVPVPKAASHEGTLHEGKLHEGTIHETITSAYETNISINKLLRERHKGSLAAMGRIFGNKQRELQKQRSSASLIPTTPKKRKRRCHWLRPVHICLALTVIVILTVTILTLLMIQTTRELESALAGYHFNYKTRELDFYPWSDPTEFPQHLEAVLSKSYLGVGIRPGVPFNCTNNTSPERIPNEVACFKWYNTTTVRLAVKAYETTALCVGVEWDTKQFDPLLEDCIDLSEDYGSWYGGHISMTTYPLGRDDVPRSLYLPGEVFGPMAERFWISTKGVAVVARYDFPLHLRISSGNKRRLCLSSWYGHQPGRRRLSYSICRAPSHKAVHSLVMRQFFQANSPKLFDQGILSDPVLTRSRTPPDGRGVRSYGQLKYSYILNKGNKPLYSLLTGTTTNASVSFGFQISPYVRLSDALSMNSSIWIQSTDMDIARVFNKDGSPHTLLNASDDRLAEAIEDLLPSDNNRRLVHVTDLFIGNIRGQDFYAIGETTNTFQPYIQNFISAIFNTSNGPVMASTILQLQQSPAVVYLQPTIDLSLTIRQVLHSSLMGYNLINPGEISSSLSEAQLLRTLQLALFLPVIQVSESFEDYFNNSETRTFWDTCMDARKYLQIAETVQAHMTNNHTHPLYSAVWWQDVDSKTFHHVSDQFIFNGQFLVAPVVNATTNTRTVLIPNGVWVKKSVLSSGKRSFLSKTVYVGPRTEEFNVPIDEILVFEYGGNKQSEFNPEL